MLTRYQIWGMYDTLMIIVGFDKTDELLFNRMWSATLEDAVWEGLHSNADLTTHATYDKVVHPFGEDDPVFYIEAGIYE